MSVSRNRTCLVLAVVAMFMLVAGCSQQPSTTSESSAAASMEAVPAIDNEAGATPTRTAASTPPAEAPAPEKPAPTEVFVDVAAGTRFDVELLDTLSSGTNHVGDPVRGRLVTALIADGRSIAPAGAEVHGIVTEVEPLKKFGGQPKISLMFESLAVDGGTRIPVMASHSAAGKKQAGRDAAKIGGGVVAGAVIGHQVDDDKGKEIGAILGGAIGTAVAANTGKEVELEPGTTISVVLQDDVRVRLGS